MARPDGMKDAIKERDGNDGQGRSQTALVAHGAQIAAQAGVELTLHLHQGRQGRAEGIRQIGGEDVGLLLDWRRRLGGRGRAVRLAEHVGGMCRNHGKGQESQQQEKTFQHVNSAI